MTLRSVFSRLLSRSQRSIHRALHDNIQHASDRYDIEAPTVSDHLPRYRWRQYLLRYVIISTLLLSAIWLLLAIRYQFGERSAITWLAGILVIGVLGAVFASRAATTGVMSSAHPVLSHQATTLNTAILALYAVIWLIGVGWFLSIEPQQHRDWMPEVSQRLSYERNQHNPDLITLTNVRNFDWHSTEDATVRWETRTIDMAKLSGIDVINAYWMGPLIAHTLISFRFDDDRPLAFSFEIRKEKGESFSALAGFFRRYELSLIAAEERDIIYTRSHIRGEHVYVLPLSQVQQHEIKSLFESYLTAADALNTQPNWYNTLTRNCTNIVFYMARTVSDKRLPWDYRIWVSGWLPNYLYDIGMLETDPKNNGHAWSIDDWYEHAHIKAKKKEDTHPDSKPTECDPLFSVHIRQNIATTPPACSHSDTVSPL